MGSSSSKVAKGAARKYPARAPGAAVPQAMARQPRAEAPKTQSKTLGSSEKDEAIRADATDRDFPTGDFSRRLHQMGIADSNPTYSPSSTASTPFGSTAPSGPHFAPSRSNPTLVALGARDRLQDEAEDDFANMGRGGRRFLDMRTMVDAMKFRDRGIPEKDIEAKLRIQPGLLSKLGKEKVFSHVTSPN
ncbi:hypothetical protein FLAG1_09485 [Fusarium langsethiae]|uniref:Helix-turn-helix domain-containing protein n=1 Tax=Fusarium langsethiae TaxID=179993 RepID=A0A0M9EQ99_FUSLA|nr:hypothetical protein FLAG1_09485 [Fusarium langsethiae]GKU05706.1 unnamed protein product [Fusarium langsethiae]GKU10750.1 unnamed protein product [Fusarium langsethiae]